MDLVIKVDKNRYFNVIFGEDILFRILKRDSVIKEKNNLKKLVRHKNLVEKNNLEIINQIIALDTEIKAIINNDRFSVNKKSGYDDKIVLIEDKTKRLKNLEKILGVGLSKEDEISICGHCNAFRFGEVIGKSLGSKNQERECPICSRIINKSFDVLCLPNAIKDFLAGEWFEFYASKFFELNEWKIFTRVYVFGSSGVEHEVDFLAVKKGISIIGECKTGNITRRDVSNFIAKYYDINCTYAMLISINRVDPGTLKYIRKNPNLIYLDNIKKDSNINKKILQLDKALVN